MKTTLALFVAVVLVCAAAMTVTGRDNACGARGGHVTGAFAQHCEIP